MRENVTLACTVCKQRNYDTEKNKRNNPDRLEMKKFCKFCGKHTVHKETKSLNLEGVSDMAKGFIKGVKAELKKVVWPTKKQLINSTLLVLVLVIALSAIILGFDVILEFIDSKLWSAIQNVIG